MNEFKFQLTSIFLVALLAVSAYWSFTKISKSTVYRQSELVEQSDSKIIIDSNRDDESTEDEDDADDEKDIVPVEIENKKPNSALTGEKKSLESKLQGLVDDNIYMKKGSYGTRVGTVQKFLSLYFANTKQADNDYGPGTFEDIKKFQKAEGLTVDGQAGASTYKKMIALLPTL